MSAVQQLTDAARDDQDVGAPELSYHDVADGHAANE
jgi:hypothetical protein